MLRTILLIGIGGGIGSILRYLTSVFAQKYIPVQFPIGTFLVNILGCLAVGLLFGLFERQQFSNPDLRFLLITGFCGGYTTFSAFALENINLFDTGNWFTAYFYIASSVVAGLFFVWLGAALTR